MWIKLISCIFFTNIQEVALEATQSPSLFKEVASHGKLLPHLVPFSLKKRKAIPWEKEGYHFISFFLMKILVSFAHLA